jgi:hypothetical protein
MYHTGSDGLLKNSAKKMPKKRLYNDAIFPPEMPVMNKTAIGIKSSFDNFHKTLI